VVVESCRCYAMTNIRSHTRSSRYRCLLRTITRVPTNWTWGATAVFALHNQ